MTSQIRTQFVGGDDREGAVFDGKFSEGFTAPAIFPAEIWIIIAEFLAGRHALGTLAKLATASRMLEAVATPVLYATMTVPVLTIYCNRTRGSRTPLEGFYLTKFLVVKRLPADPKLLQRLMPNLKMIVTELGNVNTCSIYIYQPLNISTVLGVLNKTAGNSVVPACARGRSGRDYIPPRWLGSIIIAEEGCLRFDVSEGYLSTFKNLQILPQNKVVFGKSNLPSLWSYWIWMGHHAPMRLKSISLLLENSEDEESYCQRGTSDKSSLELSLGSEELQVFVEMLASSLCDGPAMLFDYPNVVIKGLQRTEVDVEQCMNEIQETFNTQQGVVAAILPKGLDSNLVHALKVIVRGSPSTSRQTFLIAME